NDKAHVTVAAGQVSGGVVGAGASAAILSVEDNVSALADDTLHAGGNIAVKATLDETVDLVVIDGAVGFARIGAAVGVVNDNSLTQASLGSVTGAGAVSVQAISARNFNETTGQVSVGAVGVGVSYTRVNVNTDSGGTYASVDPGATLSSIGS